MSLPPVFWRGESPLRDRHSEVRPIPLFSTAPFHQLSVPCCSPVVWRLPERARPRGQSQSIVVWIRQVSQVLNLAPLPCQQAGPAFGRSVPFHHPERKFRSVRLRRRLPSPWSPYRFPLRRGHPLRQRHPLLF